MKSQVGSFGNNFNNRVEEALGNATDFWTAYKKGVFKPSQKPWLGYLFMLEEDEKSVRPTQRIGLKPFGVDEAFQELSYAKRYELVCERLVRELLYDAACFFTSSAKTGIRGAYDQPNEELSIRNFEGYLKPLALTDGEYELDPIADLRPVCPNSHAMLHRGEGVLSIEKLRARLKVAGG